MSRFRLVGMVAKVCLPITACISNRRCVDTVPHTVGSATTITMVEWVVHQVVRRITAHLQGATQVPLSDMRSTTCLTRITDRSQHRPYLSSVRTSSS